jgi:glyoxylase-like metal-dependent hydrolase (beta-lactamase superfamily II)
MNYFKRPGLFIFCLVFFMIGISRDIMAEAGMAQPRLEQLIPNAWLLTGNYFDEHMTVVDTSAGLVVLFPEEKIMVTGDLVLGESSLPVIHRDSGGSISNLISILDQLKGFAGKYTIIVPGHGTYTGPAVIQDQEAYLKELQRAVRDARKSALDLEQAKKNISMSEYRDHWLYEFVHQANIETMWREVKIH